MTIPILLSLVNPTGIRDKKQVGNLHGASLTIAAAELAKQHDNHTLLVSPSLQIALKILREIKQFTNEKIFFFPDWETLPYDNFSPQKKVISDRIKCLYQLPNRKNGITVVSISTLLQKQSPRQYLLEHTLILKIGALFSPNELCKKLKQYNYHQTNQVSTPGEYTSHGSILDLFPMGNKKPCRIDFLNNKIDTIRTFNLENQRSTKNITEILLLPAHEFLITKTAIKNFQNNWKQRFDVRSESESIYMKISKGIWPSGIEYWKPLFFEHTETLFDYITKDSQLITIGNIESAIDTFLTHINYRYEQRKADPLRPLLEPNELWLKKDKLFQKFKQFPQATLSINPTVEKQGRTNVLINPLPNLLIKHTSTKRLTALLQFSKKFSGKIIFSVKSEGRRETLLALLQDIKLYPISVKNLYTALENNSKYNLILGESEHGFIHTERQVALICENDLFENQENQQQIKYHAKAINNDAIIHNLEELKRGQLVVHIEHGIGQYIGLQTLTIGSVTTEFMVLEYQNNAKLYVPVSSLNLISQYSTSTKENVNLHKLGSETWIKTRRKAAEKIRDIAAELLDIYAKREINSGYKFVLDNKQYSIFKAGFPFQETEDQRTAIDSVLSDMCQEKAMDRLVCGDVGLGKTEVAMRAAFVSTNNDKQVAVLVPTTLLAQQHFANFRDRFANLPIRVEVLSRFKSTKEQKIIIQDVANGKIDVLVGTHKLLSSNIKFKDLGLLIIDEEHRFGVRQKETVKTMRTNLDILTLTATPIPRTLNMAMHGIRDLSIITTPPVGRLSIKTLVMRSDDNMIRDAVLREIMRGGQVYFLHNQIETIDEIAINLKKLIPEAHVITAHGQMPERKLEKVMNDFYHQRFNLLVCTTIIETGIDIPTANTIIVNRADHLGLAQLHQLRGRVGRAHQQAYAYLLTPSPKEMTKDATKRLSAIASLENLGAGFTLATHDLEIRGAGELLGEEQSGQIQSIGFALYIKMLEQAVESLKTGKEPLLDILLREKTEIEMQSPAFIPESYIFNVNTRLSMYKKIANTPNRNELIKLKAELIDRFGTLPDAAQNLLSVCSLRIQATPLKIKKIKIYKYEQRGSVEFYPDADINPVFVAELLQSRELVMENPTKFRFAIPSQDRCIQYIADMLEKFKKNLLPNE
ncbi:transcription-repair-coupling factor [Candidatus Photodesmus blepharus]|uniref:Transcription-repair-coupling factor n=1 Tax=Candidatus Photodesmus blepharonis TaxID=1179155 RepID=A0A084CML3_9GAMM|nr:transcription-repair coupling factor [Candidatus Photodesmus blepharus]KEY91042.1 transcription-repair-coupling factor [Candidatus Photodesmus blepharus]